MYRLALLFIAGPEVIDVERTALERDERFSVEFVTDLDAALAALEDREFDCVVTTDGHPTTDDGAVLDAMQARAPSLPVIVYSSEQSLDAVSDVLARDGVEFVPRGTENASLLLADRAIDLVDRTRVEQQAANLRRVSSVLSDVNRLLVRAQTRDELEQGVCDRLAGSDPYVFAWVGGLDESGDCIVPRAAAGASAASYLDSITVTTDETPTGAGPGGRALRTGEVQVVHDTATDTSFEPWRQAAVDCGFQSVAAVPLTYEQDDYGILAVYADRRNAFDEEERDLLTEVGRDIGYAIHSIETRETLARYARLVETLPVGVYRTDPVETGVIREANPGLATILGADSVDEVIGLRPADLYVDSTVRNEMLADLESGDVVTREFDLERLDEGTVTVEATLVLHETASGEQTLVGALRDVTLERRLEADLESERAFVEQLFDISPVAVTVLDAEGRIVRANAHAETVLGLEASNIAGRTYDASEWEAIDSDGTPLSSSDLPFATVRETQESVYEFEHGIKRPSGEVVWLSINMVPVLEDGEFVRAVATLTDVTTHREYEQTILERQDQLEFFNSLLRHEVLNGMTVVLGHADTLAGGIDADDPLAASVDKIEERGLGIVARVKYVRQILERLTDPSEPRDPVDLAAVTADRVEQLSTAHPNAEVTLDAPETAAVTADDLLGEVVAHLIENGIIHNDCETPTVEVRIEVDERTTTLRVADDGPGLPDALREALFDHERPRTTTGGFGLYLVDSLVTQYGGTVHVEPNEPRGTVVTVELPTG
ncbi:PAS domain S-box protein [Halorarius litoreus]|uniref:PAS domain S-box protein n=1 Tax=Halorarius litoreus TaxID=2962676 RepID=UPI0020CDA65B|nr:PAS domain S-box protein [Halorarius litoreus]